MDTAKKITAMTADYFGVPVESVQPTTEFARDLGANSIDAVELALAYEDTFEIDLPDEDVEKIRSVQDAVKVVEACKTKAVGR